MKNKTRAGGYVTPGLIVLGALFALLVVLFVASGINQRAALQKSYNHFPPPGQLIQVEGHLMHIYCTGNGSPTVVIDAGNGSFSLEWKPVQDQLSQTTRVCTYDRSGYGWSEPGPQPRDGSQVVDELHTLLRAAVEVGPYVLVGHSLGGVHVRMYAFLYPDEVAGLVLVDTAFPLGISPELQAQMQSSISFYQVMNLLTSTGFLRILGPLGGEDSMPETALKLPAELQETYLNLLLDPKHYQTASAEMQQLPETFWQTNQRMPAGTHPLGELPLIVLTAGKTSAPGSTPFNVISTAVDERVIDFQFGMVGLSGMGEQRVVPESGHLMHLDVPQEVVKAVLDVMK